MKDGKLPFAHSSMNSFRKQIDGFKMSNGQVNSQTWAFYTQSTNRDWELTLFCVAKLKPV